MKKHLTLLLLAAFMALSGTIGAQPAVVTVGTGTTGSNVAPFNNFYKNSYTQMVYSSQSLTDAGMTAGYIGAIAYDCAAVGALTLDEITIYMGTTTSATIASTAVTSLVPMADLTQVFHATNFAMPSQTGWFQVVLDSPFQYNPATDGNLAIVVCKKASSCVSGLTFKYTSASNTVAYRRSDTDTNCYHFPTSATTRATNLPNIQFTVNASSTFCFPPTGFAVSDVNSNSINVSWNANDAASYQVAIEEAANQFDPAAASWNTTSATSYTFTSLTPNTAYKVYLRTVCSDNPSAPAMINVATTSIPATLPYVASFEDDDTTGWAFANGGLANYWVIDTATHCGENSTRALYITNGTESHPNEYTINSACAVFAYRPITFGESGQYDIAFDWKANGEGSADFLRAALVPASVELTAGTAAFSGLTASATPDGWIPLDGGGKLNLVSDWQHQRVATPVAAGTYNIVFYWRNDASVGTRPPAAVDNISIAASVCLGIDSVDWETTETTATITAFSSSTPSEYMLIYQARGYQQVDTAYSYTGIFNITDLRVGNYYDGSIYTICGSDTTFANYDFNFRTDCGTISDFPWDFGFEGVTWMTFTSGATNIRYPYCWTAINGNGGNTYLWKSYTSTANAHSGVNAAYFYSTTTATAQAALDEWLKTPTVELTGNEQLSFWVRGLSTTTTANYHTRVSVRVSPEDTLDADSLYINVPLSGGPTCNGGYYTDLVGTTYTQYFADLSGLSGNRRIAFVVDTNSYSFYMDDLRLITRSNCPDAINVRVEGYTATTATMAWGDTATNPTTTSWDLYFGQEGFNSDTVSSISVTDTTYTFEDLMPQTSYEFYVVAHCSDGSDANATTRVAFTTACAAIPADSLPYMEDFEAYGTGTTAQISPCWTKFYSAGVTYPYPYATTPITGNRSLYFYSVAANYSYAAMPMFENDLNTLRLRFNVKSYSTLSSTYGSVLVIGVMSNPDDIATFDTIRTIDLSSGETNAVRAVEMFFDTYNGEGSYIAFLAPLTGPYPFTTNYIKLDDVVVDLMPACRRSTNLYADNVMTNSVDLHWHNSSENITNHQVAYSTIADFNPDTCTTTLTANDTTITLTGLSPYTRYYWAVRTNCSDSSEWSEVFSFITSFDCGDGNVVNILDTIGTGTTGSYSYPFYAYHSTSTTSTYPFGQSYILFTAQELADMGLVVDNRINGISLQTGTSGGGTIDGISIYMAETDFEGFTTTTPANDTIPVADMQLVFHGSKTFNTGRWEEIIFDSVFNYSGSRNLMMLFRRDSSVASTVYFNYTSTSPVYTVAYSYQTSPTANRTCTRSNSRPNMAFNVCTTIPFCDRPDSVTVVEILPTSAQFAWVGTSDNYEVAYGPQGFDPDSTDGVHQVVNTNSIIIPGLTAQTNYDFYVRTLCTNPTDMSSWTFVYHFRTPCISQALPYTEDFESYGTGSTQTISPCWIKGTNNTTQYPYPYSSNAITGQRSLYFYANHPSTATSTPYYSYAALPLMDAAIDSLQVSFKMRRYSTTSDSYTSRIVVGLMSDPADIATFTAVDTFDLKNEASLSVHGFEVSFAGHTNDGQFIAFYDEVPPLYGSGTSCVSYVYLDDVVVDYIPTCPRPINVTISDSTITGTTAVVSWTDRVVPGQGYELEYGIAGFTLGTGTRVQSNTNPTTLTGLQPSSQYEVYVRALCSATDMGEWSFATTFYTTCEAISSLPITYDLEDFTTGTSAEFPLCWTRINDATGTTNYYPYVYSSTTYAHSGSNCLYFYATSTSTYASNMYAVLPEVNTTLYPANTLEVVFWGRGSSTTTNDASIIVGMMTNPADATTFVAVDTIQMDATLTEYTVPFSNYTGNGGHIAFYKVRGTTTGYAYIDDITIEQQSACARPYDLVTTGATPTSATVDWTDSIGASQWVIEYRAIDSTTIHSVTVTSHPYTITGLQPSTSYTFHVAARCPTVADVSDFSREWLNFATSQVPAAVPYFYNFESADEWNNWQTVSNQTTNWYRGTAEASDGSYSMYVSMDDGATRSTNMAQVINACAYRDIDFGTTPSSYELTFDVKVGGTTDANYDGVSIILADPSVYVEPTSTNITSPWGHVNDVAIASYRRDTNWNTRTCYLDNVSGIKRVVFYWFNQATGASHPFVGGPAAIDSISITEQPCPRPYNLNATNITPNSARLNWSSGAGNDFIVTYRRADQTASSNINVPVSGANYLNVYNLDNATKYYFWVRKVCSTESTSDYSASRSFTTACGIFSASDTLRENFEGYTGATYSATDGVLPTCWEGYSNGTNNVAPHIIGSGSYWYAHDTNAVILTSGSSTYGDVSILRLPMMAEPVSTLTMSYWMSTESQTNGVLSVGYLTGDDYDNDFVAVKVIPASATTYHGSGSGTSAQGVYDTVSFDSVPATAQYIAFKWVYNTSFFSVCLDDIEVTSSGACMAPTITSVDSTYNTVSINWIGVADRYEVGIRANDDNQWIVDSNVVSGPYTFANLQPATQYVVRVRQFCDSVTASTYAYANIATDSLPCFAPANITIGEVTNATAEIDWTAPEGQSEWYVHVFNTIFDSTYTVSAHPATVSGFVAGNTYNVAVASHCGGIVESEYSDTIQFTTVECDPVSNVTATVNGNSATIAWTNGANNTGAWQLIYGEDSEVSTDDTPINVTTNPYTISNLAEGNYEVFVQAVCGAGWFSGWSENAHATFTIEAGEGISDINSNLHVVIYPNPTSNATTISLSGVNGDVTIAVVDMNGRTVQTDRMECSGDCTKKLEVSGLAQGAYFVRIYGENVNTVKKLIVK